MNTETWTKNSAIDVEAIAEELGYADEAGQREWALEYGDALCDEVRRLSQPVIASEVVEKAARAMHAARMSRNEHTKGLGDRFDDPDYAYIRSRCIADTAAALESIGFQIRNDG
jgi:hypothetical protein